MSIVRLETGTATAASPAAEAERVTALRHRAAECLERAYGFLQAGPDPWARLRAEILCGARPAADLGSELARVQSADGSLPPGTLVSGGAVGFPPIDLEASSEGERGILGTLEALLQAGDAGQLHGSWLESAVRFLERSQSSDGSFRIALAEGAGDPERAAVFFTGMVAGILGRTPLSRPSGLEAAGAFLAERFSPEVVEGDDPGALLAFAHFFTNVAHDLSDEALQWCGRALEKGFRSRRLDGVTTVRVLLTCDAQAMPGADFDVVELLERVLEEQAGDGGFDELSLGGPAARTTQTFDAMLAVVRLCGALGD